MEAAVVILQHKWHVAFPATITLVIHHLVQHILQGLIESFHKGSFLADEDELNVILLDKKLLVH